MFHRLRQHALTAFIILVPLCYLPQYSRVSQENFFRYASICLVASFVGNIWLSSFLALNVFLFIYNGAQVGFEQVINITFGCLIFTFSRYFFKTNKFETIYKPVLIVACVSLVWMVFQLFHIDPIFTPIKNDQTLIHGPLGDPIGFFGIKEANGTFLTLCLPIIASINPILGLALLLPIKLSESSGVYLATAIVVLFYSWHLHKKFFKFVLIAIPLLALGLIAKDLHTDPKTFTSRFPVWHSTISYALKNPIGYGPDSYRNINKHKNFRFVGDNFYNHAILMELPNNESMFRYYSPTQDTAKIDELSKNVHNTSIAKGKMDEWDNPHNTYLNVLFQYGILGLVLLFGLIREVCLRFKYAMKDKELIVITSCLIAYAVTGIVHFPLELARTAFLFPIALGAFYARTDA